MENYSRLADRLLALFSFGPRIDGTVGNAVKGEMAVMRCLGSRQGPVTPGELCSLLDMTSSRMAAVLKTLEKKGLIRRLQDPADKRRILAALTEQGAAFCRERESHLHDDLTAVLSDLGSEDASALIRILEKMKKNHIADRLRPPEE